MLELPPETGLVSSDSSSDDEFIQQVPAHEIRLVKAYKRAKLRLRSVKSEKKRILVEEIVRKEEKMLIKKLILDHLEPHTEIVKEEMRLNNLKLQRKDRKRKISFQDVEENIKMPKIIDTKQAKLTSDSYTSSAKDKSEDNTKILQHKKRKSHGIVKFTMTDKENGYHVNISVDITKHRYIIPIKKLLRNFKPTMTEFSEYIPLELFQCVIRKILERQLTEMLVGKERLKSKEILNIYREKYPEEKDGYFIINTLVGIWRGDYNDFETVDESSETPRIHNPDKEVPFEHISSGKGVWISVVDNKTYYTNDIIPQRKSSKARKSAKARKINESDKTDGNLDIVKDVNEINTDCTDKFNHMHDPDKEVNGTEMNEIKIFTANIHDIIESSKEIDSKASFTVSQDDKII